MNVVILVPVLGRPHRVQPLLDSIKRATPEAHRVLFITSPGDTDEHLALQAAGAEHLELDQPPGPGDYARKINAGYHATGDPLLFLGADDLEFHPGWLPAALGHLRPGVGVVGTNDLGNPRVLSGEHSTHSLVTRAYADEHGTIDEPGKVLHEGYPHEFVDDELVATAKHRGAWAFAPDSLVEHLHPNWGKAPLDALYAGEADRMVLGRRLFRRRRRLWTRAQPPVGADPQPSPRRPSALDASVLVATFGDDTWADLARSRAIPSAEQLGVPVIHVHGDTLHDARNAALDQADTEWVCHLDADDELEAGYFDEMAAATADLRAPAVRYVRNGRPRFASIPKRVDMRDGNWLVIGTCVRTELARAVRWRDWPFYEDWDFWQRCWMRGASIEAVPRAVYRAHARLDSRNRAPSDEEKLAVHQAIRTANLGGSPNVLDFGARGDGVTDDGPAIRRALNAAARR